MTIQEHFRGIIAGATNPVVIEIGAGRGEDTIKLMEDVRNVGRAYRYLAFECEKNNVPFIRALNIPGNLELFELAVGAQCGPVSFVPSGSWPYSGSLKEPKLHRISHAWIPFQPPVEVSCVTLDSVFQSCRLDHCDFIWMDTQGADDLIIQGGQQAFSKTRYVYAEVYENEEYTGQIGRKEILARLPGKWEITEDWGGDALFRNTAL